MISTIQHFSIGDGPGIRTTVFLQGCNLHCPWCHNPEAIPSAPQLLYYEKLCTHCGICAQVCPAKAQQMAGDRHIFDRNKCVVCGACTRLCPSSALRLSGMEMTVQQVMKELEEDRSFYAESGGGVTLSGGEPLLQPDFCAEILALCKAQKMHTAMETAGCVPFSAFAKVLPVTDLFLFDIKCSDEHTYINIMGGSLKLILSNLEKLFAANAQVVVRIPVIGNFNDTTNGMSALAERLTRCGVRQVELLPFHSYGSSKYAALEKDCVYDRFIVPDKDTMQAFTRLFIAQGIACKIQE